MFRKYNVKENLDNLHAVVTAARARKQANYDSKDVWREDLQPRAAVRARTIPLLEHERDRLRAELAQVFPQKFTCVFHISHQLVILAHRRELRTGISDAAKRACHRGG